ncbi:Pls/PosA family non-ribosomal peptide synthetase [Streptomyces sp. NPDC026672]|uniref:Pls/PosA family non-ribosomal peptide synthetase n=1 Tax=unclassified Streptomyces TaxID=2593676 RepID=UPI0033EAC214
MVERSAEIRVSGPDTAVAPPGGAGPSGSDTERRLAEVLADVARVEHVSPDSHFFTDLGANSMVMAQFCARLRKRDDLPSASIKDIYRHPTVRTLAAALAPTAPAPDALREREERTPEPPPRPVNRLHHALCGTAQLLAFLAYSFAAGVLGAQGYEWIAAGTGLVDVYLRSVAFGGTAFVAVCLFPVAAKWLLVGRWKPGEFPLWGPAYLRFWLVRTLLHANPMVLFVGNPLYVLYLRALGAHIGKGVTILSPHVPVCTDLITIGSGTVVRKDSYFLGYHAHAGRLRTGPVTLGRDVFVGEKTVLDINTAIGDGAQLGHSSSLHPGQRVPDGESWHGSPAQPAHIDHVRVPAARCTTARRARFVLATLLQLFLLYIPLTFGGAYMLFTEVPALGDRLDPEKAGLAAPALLGDALLLSLVLFAGFFAAGLALLLIVPRVVHRIVRPDRVYPLYGLHFALHQATARITNAKFFAWLFGDSSYIVPYLRGIGYDLGRVEQTGSNFGTEVQHASPTLVSVGAGTMVADGLSVLNAEISATSFRVTRTSIGARNFLGNGIAYPAGGRTGDNCLLATKVMIPLDGEVREGVGLLGSPPFEIPRSVERDARFDHLRAGDELRRRLRTKNRYNLRSMALMLGVRWLLTFALTLFALLTVDLYGAFGHVVVACYLPLTLAFSTGYYILVERCVTAFRPLRPQLCSIYDERFWLQERLWKIPIHYFDVFNGTPYKALVWRLLGVRIGRRVFDDGCLMTERTLTTVGDECVLNAGSTIQCHSQEDGTFKSDGTTLGAFCTLGVSAHVHYGVTLGEGAVLAPDSFLMKGEEVPAHARWGGNPATEQPSGAGPATVTATSPVDGAPAGVR